MDGDIPSFHLRQAQVYKFYRAHVLKEYFDQGFRGIQWTNLQTLLVQVWGGDIIRPIFINWVECCYLFDVAVFGFVDKKAEWGNIFVAACLRHPVAPCLNNLATTTAFFVSCRHYHLRDAFGLKRGGGGGSKRPLTSPPSPFLKFVESTGVPLIIISSGALYVAMRHCCPGSTHSFQFSLSSTPQYCNSWSKLLQHHQCHKRTNTTIIIQQRVPSEYPPMPWHAWRQTHPPCSPERGNLAVCGLQLLTIATIDQP